MKKRVGAMLAAGVMACGMGVAMGLSGCGGAGITEFVMPKNGYDGSKVTITFANTTGQTLAEIIDPAIKRFNQLYPNITVKMDRTSQDWDDLNSTISTQLTSGKQPNVAFCYSDHVASYNQAGAVVALDQFFLHDSGYADIMVTPANGKTETLALTEDQEKDYIEAFWNDGKVYRDGHLYTLPFAKSTEVLFYNKDKFEEWGLTVPTTWKEMEETCKTITEKDPNCIALGYDSGANYFITRCMQKGLPYTSLDSSNHYQFNTEAHRAIVEEMRTWSSKRYITTKDVYGKYSSNLFKETKADATKCYMSIGSTGGSAYQLADVVDGKAGFEVGVAAIPQEYSTVEGHVEYKEDYKPQTILQGPNVCIFKKKNPQEVVASWLLVKFLTTDLAFQARYSQASGYSPVTESIFNNKTYQDFIKGVETDNVPTLMGQVASICYTYANTKAFYTSPAFIGSSVARKQVDGIVTKVLKGTETNIERAFTNAIAECSRFRDI